MKQSEPRYRTEDEACSGEGKRLIKGARATGGGGSQQDSVPAFVSRGRDVAAIELRLGPQGDAGERLVPASFYPLESLHRAKFEGKRKTPTQK